MHEHIIDPDPVIVRFELRKKCRTGFLNAEMVFFIHTNPEIPGACKLKINQDPFAYSRPRIHTDFETSHELLVVDGDLVFFVIADSEIMLHVQKYENGPCIATGTVSRVCSTHNSELDEFHAAVVCLARGTCIRFGRF